MAAKKRQAKVYAVRQGYACRCEQCEHERSHGVVAQFKGEKFCPGCGHGFIDLRQPDREDTSQCTFCGQTGHWLEAKPVLPFMPKHEAIDAVIGEARAIVARVLEVYRPEYVQKVVETDHFSLLATVKRLERSLGELDQSAEARG